MPRRRQPATWRTTAGKHVWKCLMLAIVGMTLLGYVVLIQEQGARAPQSTPGTGNIDPVAAAQDIAQLKFRLSQLQRQLQEHHQLLKAHQKSLDVTPAVPVRQYVPNRPGDAVKASPLPARGTPPPTKKATATKGPSAAPPKSVPADKVAATAKVKLGADKVKLEADKVKLGADKLKAAANGAAQVIKGPRPTNGTLFEARAPPTLMTPVQAPHRELALLIICANRAEYLRRCLELVEKYHPGKGSIPIVISQDGDNQEVQNVIESFQERMQGKTAVAHIFHPNNPHLKIPNAYYKLANHYLSALDAVFYRAELSGYKFTETTSAIVLEEDLLIAPDFFEYFAAMVPILHKDSRLMAVSAWNDNGMAANVKDPLALYRSDFFPGLGWMLTRRLWDELSRKWPVAYWDDWLREPKQRNGREFIRPEISRTLHIGQKGGASQNAYSKYLDAIKLNDQMISWRSLDLSYLERTRYEKEFLGGVKAAPLVSLRKAKTNPGGEVRVAYTDNEFESMARQLGIMDNVKAGVPRTAYFGIVTFWLQDTKIYLVPEGLGYK